MRIVCPGCHSADIARTRRRRVLDRFLASFGRWPYICRACHRRFRAGLRYPPSYERRHSPVNKDAAADARPGPQMAYRADTLHPIAKIVLCAESHAQMDRMLLAIGQAIAHYERPVKQYSAKQAT